MLRAPLMPLLVGVSRCTSRQWEECSMDSVSEETWPSSAMLVSAGRNLRLLHSPPMPVLAGVSECANGQREQWSKDLVKGWGAMR